jgi:predicted PurR-regulated permease PerM
MLSLVFWAALLGALGALMAVPLTLLVKALLVDADPDAAWLQPLLSADSEPRRRARRRRPR